MRKVKQWVGWENVNCEIKCFRGLDMLVGRQERGLEHVVYSLDLRPEHVRLRAVYHILRESVPDPDSRRKE